MSTYSFLDVKATIVGVGGAFALGEGSGSAEEGISIEDSEDLNTMSVGADGAAMHSLHANKSGRVTVRLQKTSPVNALLSEMLNLQRTSGALHGRNTIVVVNVVSGDAITCQKVAFKKRPSLSYGKDAGMNEWDFDAGQIDVVLGALNT